MTVDHGPEGRIKMLCRQHENMTEKKINLHAKSVFICQMNANKSSRISTVVFFNMHLSLLLNRNMYSTCTHHENCS
jgi:hypothetical protein